MIVGVILVLFLIGALLAYRREKDPSNGKKDNILSFLSSVNFRDYLLDIVGFTLSCIIGIAVTSVVDSNAEEKRVISTLEQSVEIGNEIFQKADTAYHTYTKSKNAREISLNYTLPETFYDNMLSDSSLIKKTDSRLRFYSLSFWERAKNYDGETKSNYNEFSDKEITNYSAYKLSFFYKFLVSLKLMEESLKGTLTEEECLSIDEKMYDGSFGYTELGEIIKKYGWENLIKTYTTNKKIGSASLVLEIDEDGIVNKLSATDNSNTIEIGEYTGDGKKIKGFGYRFLQDDNIEKIKFSLDVEQIWDEAFFEAKSIKEYETDGLHQMNVKNNALIEGNMLLDYPSKAEKTDYTAGKDLKRVLSMDNAIFGTLDLSSITNISFNALSGTFTDTIVLDSNVKTDYNDDDEPLQLFGLHAKKFKVTGEGPLRTAADGKILVDNKRIVKIAADYNGSLDSFDGYTLDRFAFDSISQALLLWNKGASKIAGNKAYEFYGQQNGVFFYNGNVIFCDQPGENNPTEVAYEKRFQCITPQDQIIQKMLYYGVPNDASGIHEEVFGVPFSESIKNAQSHPNPALNVVLSLIWGERSGDAVGELEGVGTTPYYTREKLEEYRLRILMSVYNGTENISLVQCIRTFPADDSEQECLYMK